MTYQNGGHRIVMGENEGLVRVKPMDYLESRRRRNRCISMTLLALFLTVCGTLIAWRISQHQHAGAVKSPLYHSNDDDDDDDSYAPPASLVELNQSLKDQSKVMEKGCESTLLIIRHCEKVGGNQVDSDGNYHCSYLGQERS